MKKLSPTTRRRFKWALLFSGVCLLIPVLQVGCAAFVDPPTTGPMVLRWVGGKVSAARYTPNRYAWVDLSRVPESFLACAWQAEDQRFFEHRGFDWEQIRWAWKASRATGAPLRGASTITQQCARSLFLWQGRSWVRKGLEAYYTVLMEMILSKERILELYVNVIELDEGVYGLEAGAQHHYGVSASELTREQAAMLVACMPSPKKRNPSAADEFLIARQLRIIQLSTNAVLPFLDDGFYRQVLADYLAAQPVPVCVSPNGKFLLTKSDDNNGFMISVLDQSSRDVVASSFSRNSQLSLTWRPDGQAIAFQEVAGTDRPLWLLDIPSRTTKKLPVPVSRTALPPLRWSPDGKRLAYYHGDWTQGKLLVFELERPGSPTIVFESLPATSDFTWSPDGRRIAAATDKSSGSVTLAALGEKEQSRIQVVRNGEIRDLAWKPDGRGLLATVRAEGEEFYKLVEIDLKSGTSAPRIVAPGDISRPVWCPDGRSFLYHVNSGGFGTVALYDPHFPNPRPLDPTNGILRVQYLSNDGERAYAHFAPSDGPPTLCEMVLSTGEATTIYACPADQRLKSAGAKAISLLGEDGIAVPAFHWSAASRSNQMPAVLIAVHGGPHLQARPTWDATKHSMLAHGCDLIAVNYRGSSGFGRRFEEIGEEAGRASDILAACDYAITELKIPRHRVFLFGESHGASLVLAAASRAGQIGGLVLLSWIGTDAESSPLEQPRVMAFHGDEDPIAPLKNAQASFQRLFSAKVARRAENRMHVFRNEGHYFSHASSWAIVCTETLKLMQLNDGG